MRACGRNVGAAPRLVPTLLGEPPIYESPRENTLRTEKSLER